MLGPRPRAAAIRILVLIAAAILVFGFVLLPVRFQGVSMLPTYRDGGLNFANRSAFMWREPSRGDVVAIRMAGLSVLYVKRIVGLPGEEIEIAVGVVMINRKPLVEPNVMFRAPWNLPSFTLARDEYFVVGDNRGMAMQNHDFGRVKRDRIVGRVLF